MIKNEKSFGVVARIKPPEGYIGIWINIYRRGRHYMSGGSYQNRRHADMIAKRWRYDCVYVHVKVR